MSLTQWEHNGWLRRHTTSRNEITNLLDIVERDLADTSGGISDDWRFGIAYNAAIKLCTILLYAEGFRAEKNLQHYRTIQTLPLIMEADKTDDTKYLDACRKKRNIVEYEQIGTVTDQDADELIEFVKEFKREVKVWLKENHPELI